MTKDEQFCSGWEGMSLNRYQSRFSDYVVGVACMFALACGCGRGGYGDSEPEPVHGDGSVGTDEMPLPNCTDVDGDGYLEQGCPGVNAVDCDDNSSARHPGAMEVCGNGEDEDCSGDDLDCLDAVEPLSTSQGGGLTSVGNTGFLVVFDEAIGGVPGELRALDGSGENVLYTGTEKDERFIAVSHWNNVDNWFSWRPDSPVTPVLIHEGPAAVQIELTWQSGGAPADGMEGRSRYTVFPDGRIHRDERVHVYGLHSGWFLAYAAIGIDQWDQVIWNTGDTSGVHDKVADGSNYRLIVEQAGETGSYFCARHDSSGDTIGWSHHERGAVFPEGLRAIESAQNASVTHSLLLASEWVYNAVPVGDYFGHVMLQISGGDACSRFGDHARAFGSPPSFTFAAGGLSVSSAGDDDGDGFNEGSGCYVLSGQDGNIIDATVVGTQTLPTSAFRLQELNLAHDPLVRLDGEVAIHGRDYLLQIDTNRRGGWLYFARAIDNGTIIAIETP